jgi:hypothetical protein
MQHQTAFGDAERSGFARFVWVFVGLVLLPLSGIQLLRSLPRRDWRVGSKCPRCGAFSPGREWVRKCPQCNVAHDDRGNSFPDLSAKALKDLDLSHFKSRDAESEYVCGADDGQVSDKAPP